MCKKICILVNATVKCRYTGRKKDRNSAIVVGRSSRISLHNPKWITEVWERGQLWDVRALGLALRARQHVKRQPEKGCFSSPDLSDWAATERGSMGILSTSPCFLSTETRCHCCSSFSTPQWRKLNYSGKDREGMGRRTMLPVLLLLKLQEERRAVQS